MNLFSKNTAKFYVSIIVLIVMTLVTTMAQAQKKYTTISKNINLDSQGLYHELSPQGDSQYLKSESIFYKVTFLNRLDRKVDNFNPSVLAGKIPLHDIIVGDYAVLVYKKDRIIVFHISRLIEIEKPAQMIVSNNLSVSQDMVIVKPVLKRLNVKDRTNSKIVMNEIKMGEQFEWGKKELKVAVNDDRVNIDKPELSTKTRSFDLYSTNRTHMESREDYRKNNLRPNGNPYY